jgi:hypothetical protein
MKLKLNLKGSVSLYNPHRNLFIMHWFQILRNIDLLLITLFTMFFLYHKNDETKN